VGRCARRPAAVVLAVIDEVARYRAARGGCRWHCAEVPGRLVARPARPCTVGVPSSLFMLLDDIATVLDDVAVLTKLAAKKTAGVLGDDLAPNAQQVTGLTPYREIPVVFAVAKGSAINKLILVPVALAISALAPWAVVLLLMLGGAFLCFEGFEKVAHRWFHPPEQKAAHHQRPCDTRRASVSWRRMNLGAVPRGQLLVAIVRFWPRGAVLACGSAGR
jgi:hypothetical protein